MKSILTQFFNFLSNIPKDKLLHFTVGLVMFLFNLVILRNVILIDESAAEILSVIIVFIVSILKEVLDKEVIEGTAEVKDIIATVCGGGLGFLASILL